MAARMPGPVVKIHKRLLPLFVSLVVVCYLDRTSLAFAALQLCDEDWFNAKVYGLGSGVFYAGYVLFQVPSNLILSRLGARTWLPFITAAWGTVATCCIFIKVPASFYALRLALGITESGAFPAMWHVCGQFYPASYITVAYSVIEASIAVSQIIAAPVAAGLLQLSGVGGLAGWQHLFLAEGVATLVLAGILRWRLPASVLTSNFLDSEDKLWLMQQLQPSTPAAAAAGPVDVVVPDSKTQSASQLAGEQIPPGDESSPEGSEALQHQQRHHHHQQQPEGPDADIQEGLQATPMLLPPSQQQQQQQQQLLHVVEKQLSAGQQLLLTIRNRWIWYLMLLKALKDIALDGLVYWVPMLVHALLDNTAGGLHAGISSNSSSSSSSSSSSGEDDKHCGGKDSQLRAVLLTAIPFGTAAIAALTLGHSSEVSGERCKHIGLPLLLGGCVFATLPWLLPLQSHVPAFLAVTAAVVAADATTGPFWTWVHMAAAPGTEAVSLAAVNSVGKAGGFLGPLSFGLILHATGSYVPSILLVSAVLAVGGVLALSYTGDKQHTQYSKLQDGQAGLSNTEKDRASPVEGWQQQEWQEQYMQRRKQQRQHGRQQREQHPELELLRGSSAESSSQYSSTAHSMRPSEEG